jgi:hypothetical protein
MPMIQDFTRLCNHPHRQTPGGDFAHAGLTGMVRYGPMPGQIEALKRYRLSQRSA